MCGAPATQDSSTASSKRPTRSAALWTNRAGSRRCVELATGSSPRTELAATLHRLRSTLARLKAELELSEADGTTLPIDRLLADLDEAFALLGSAESADHEATQGLCRVSA